MHISHKLMTFAIKMLLKMKLNGSWIGSFNMQEMTVCLGYISKSVAYIGRNILNPLPSTSWNIEKNMTQKVSKAPNGNTC